MTSLDEIRLLATIGHTEGVVGKQTAQMIVGASDLRTLNAGNIMVTRREVVFLSHDDSPERVLGTIADSGFSRFPYSPTGEFDDALKDRAVTIIRKEVQFPDAPPAALLQLFLNAFRQAVVLCPVLLVIGVLVDAQ